MHLLCRVASERHYVKYSQKKRLADEHAPPENMLRNQSTRTLNQYTFYSEVIYSTIVIPHTNIIKIIPSQICHEKD